MNIEEWFSPDKIFITIAIVATIALFLVSVLISLTIRHRQKHALELCHYRPKKRLMEGNERRCFKILVELFGSKFYIVPQVELSALLNHKVGIQDRRAAYHFIENKTVDFVLCNKSNVRPICAVKLHDDNASNEPGNRPEDIQKFFQSAHIPLIYLPKTKCITKRNIVDELSRTIYETSLLSSSKKSKATR